jgi:hypothetical protein
MEDRHYRCVLKARFKVHFLDRLTYLLNPNFNKRRVEARVYDFFIK